MENSRNDEMLQRYAIPPRFDGLSVLKRSLMQVLAKIHFGTLYVFIDGRCYACGNDDSMKASIRIHHPMKMAWKCLTKGDLGFAESYLEGHFTTNDLAQLLKLMLKNRSELGDSYDGKSMLRTAANVYHKLRKNTLEGSRKNIQYHYDLGNDFYALWLDRTMTYSSALFDKKDDGTLDKEQSLASAQLKKYQRILDEIDAKAGQSILEVGCGWGGFAEKAIEKDCNIHGVTLSDEQLEFANERLKNAEGKFNLEIKDYREIDQQYDHIVSIEMFEAVGQEYWQSYFEMLKRSLKPEGKIVLQIITIKDEFFDEYISSADFIQRYIFPGGMLPSDGILSDLAAKNHLSIKNRVCFGHDYSETLARWEHSFLKVITELEALGYDKRFQRMWLYYLAYCQAGFSEERIDVVQLTLEHTL